MEEADMFDVVRVGDLGLIGEIIEMRGRNGFHSGIRGYSRTWTRRTGSDPQEPDFL